MKLLIVLLSEESSWGTTLQVWQLPHSMLINRIALLGSPEAKPMFSISYIPIFPYA